MSNESGRAMRVGLTLTSARGDTDVLVDCEPGSAIEEVEAVLEAHLGMPVSLGEGRAEDVLVQGMRIDPAAGGAHLHNPTRWLHAVGGPGAGAVIALPQGRHVLGRTGEISWDDPALSRRHVALEVSAERVTVADLGSSNGTHLDHQPCNPDEPTVWEVGQLLEIGHSVARLVADQDDGITTEPSSPGWRALVRPPRICGPWRDPTVEIPAAPTPPRRRRIPLIAIIVPAVMGVGMTVLLHNVMFLAFALMSPIMALGNHLSDRRGAAGEFRRAAADYFVELTSAEDGLRRAIAHEQEHLRDLFPDPAATGLTAGLPGRRLWERRRGDSDQLCLRIGLADQAAGVTVTGAPPVDPPRVRLVPQWLDLRRTPVIGIAGPEATRVGCVRWLIAQLATYHAPEDLALVVLMPQIDHGWRWLRWLPHLRPGDPRRCGALVGNDPASVQARVADLLELIAAREDLIRDRHTQGPSDLSAVVVVMCDYRDLRALADVASVLTRGPAVGVYCICADGSELTLPDSAAAVLEIGRDRPGYARLRRRGIGDIENILLDQVTSAWSMDLARSLAPLSGVISAEASNRPPRGARLLEGLQLEVPSAEAIRARWAADPSSTSVLLGATAGGDLSIDLRTDGPHGLIAGMTGSGKSELLQTMIASLAVANRPDRLTFVVIDYKGDSAFRECARLPHVVGKVTDLDPFLVGRALVSLRAELERRKRLLAEYGAQDIDDYHLRTGGDPTASPLPRLVIVIDEFAELAQDLPDFMAGLISLAQVGRSLGLHLLLATQRPSGVVSPAIRANTNLRIALRVGDAADSTDVLASPEAAYIDKSLPGRGWVRLGAGELREFQTARINGIAPTASISGPMVRTAPWERVGYPVQAEAGDSGANPTDLAILVGAIRQAADQEPLSEQAKPWLDPLPEVLLWDEDVSPPIDGRDVPPLPFGRSDLPHQQQQGSACFDLASEGHLFLIGAARSGRSQALRVLSASIARLTRPTDVHLYGVDGGSGALQVLSALPHCGVVASRSETIRMGRLLDRLVEELTRRQRLFADHGYGHIGEQRVVAADPLPRIVLMLDGWEGFTAISGVSEDFVDIVVRLLREGAGVGIHLVVAGDRSLLINARTASAHATRYVFRFADRGDYLLAGLSSKEIPTDLPPGRCLGPRATLTQVYLLDPDAGGLQQAAVLRSWASEATERHASVQGPRPFRLDALPRRMAFDEAVTLLDSVHHSTLIVGVGGDELMALGPDVSRSHCFIVAGPGRSGRSTVLLGAARSALRMGMSVVVVAPRPSPLRDLADQPGIAAVLATGITTEALDAVVSADPDARTVVIVDDGEGLRDTPAHDFFLRAVRGELPDVFLLLGGHTDGLGTGLAGWQAEAKKARQGLLLSPQGIGDGDLIGVRLPRSVLGRSVQPGTGLLHLGDGSLLTVATLVDDDQQ